jgi:hypothetical protein
MGPGELSGSSTAVAVESQEFWCGVDCCSFHGAMPPSYSTGEDVVCEANMGAPGAAAVVALGKEETLEMDD